MSRQVLGRGLSGLISSAEKKTPAASATHPLTIPLAQIATSPYQPRQVFDEAKLAELADSIKNVGLVQPLVVRKLDATHYQLVAGERRLRAITMLGWGKVPVAISNAGQDDLRSVALVENLQRENLNPLEVAEALRELLANSKLTHEQIADQLGKSRAWITNALRLLNLPHEVCHLIVSEQISGAHGRTLLGLAEPLSQIKLAKRVAREQISVQKLEKIVQAINGGGRKKKSTPAKNGATKSQEKHHADLSRRLGQYLGTKVNIHDNNGKGKIEIEYYSYLEIAGIIEKIGVAME